MSIIANSELQTSGEAIFLHEDILKMDHRHRKKKNAQLVDVSRTSKTKYRLLTRSTATLGVGVRFQILLRIKLSVVELHLLIEQGYVIVS
jgi:hypothetical protein